LIRVGLARRLFTLRGLDLRSTVQDLKSEI
jgi:hypothetical protein